MKSINHLEKLSTAICVLLLSFSSIQVSAQLVGTDAFLQGNFIEVGLSNCGVFASGAEPLTPGPIGPYHPTELYLGFVADSDMDGWGTGFPNYCGDYFVPGSPVEGWAIQIGSGTVYTNTDQYCSPNDIPGSVTGYMDLGTERVGEWSGNLVTPGGLDIAITQETELPVDKLYFVTHVTICNNGTADIIDFYYTRNVDPDNEQPWTGDYTTTNTIVSQPPVDCEALVTAEGLSTSCFLGLGARDSMARVTYGSFNTGAPFDVWNGVAPYSLSGTNTADEAISIAFKIPLLAAGDCKTISFAYVLDPRDLTEALEATADIDVFADGIDISDTLTAFVCVDDSTLLEIVSGGSHTWLWTPDSLLSTDTGSSVYVYAGTDTVTYLVVDTSDACNIFQQTITIIPDFTPTVADAGTDLTICIGDSIQLNGSGSTVDAFWLPGGDLDDSTSYTPYASPTATTDYILTTYTNIGCTGSDTMTVTVNPLPVVDAGPDAGICEGLEVQLEASGALAYTWDPVTDLDDPFIFNPISTSPVDVTYTVTGVDANGCANTDDVTLTVSPLPAVDAGMDTTIDIVQNEMAQLLATAPTAITYSWSPTTGLSDPNIANPIAQPSDTTTYIVTVTDALGCSNSDTVTVFVLNEFVIIIPNAFTPDGNGLNDQLSPTIVGLVEFVDFSVYNRWGERVFFTAQENVGWDGTYRGKVQELGTYIAVVRIYNFRGEEVQYATPVTVVR